MDDVLCEDLETLPDFSTKFPLNDTHLYKGFVSTNGVYYFAKDENDFYKKPNNYRHIDPIMMHFIYLMRMNGLLVTAGKKGILDIKEYLSRMKTEEQQIQRTGIQMTDFLTGEMCSFKDNNYRCLYSTIEDIMKEKEELQNDCISLIVPVDQNKIIDSLKQDVYETGLSRLLYKKDIEIQGNNFSSFSISVRSENDKVRLTEWKSICSRILSGLNQEITI